MKEETWQDIFKDLTGWLSKTPEDYVKEAEKRFKEVEEQKQFNQCQCSDPRYHMVSPDGKQWIDLDIDNLPDRFFTRDDIEIERKVETQYYLIVKGDPRVNIIKGLLEGIKYRYRIQEKKPLQITRDIIVKYKLPVTELIGEKANADPHGGLLESVFILDGHEVIIID